MAEAAVRRRTAGEWAILISKWKQSGLSASAFAAREGVRSSTLYWWSWKLRSSEQSPEVGLLPVAVVEDGAEPPDASSRWEIRLADGTAVEMTGPGAIEGLAAALRAICRRGE